MVFDHEASVVAVSQKEHEQIYPKPGWVEHDPTEIWERTQEVIGEALEKAGAAPRRHRGARHHQPARDHGRLGPQDRRAGLQRDRLAGHADGQARATSCRERRRSGPLPRQGRAAAGDLLLGAEDPLDPRQRRRRAREGRGRRPGLRQHRHVVHLEPDRRHRRRRARHRCDECQPHDADGPRDARLGRGACSTRWASRVDAARDPAPRARSTARSRPATCTRRPDRRRPRRPAGGAVRPDLLRPRRSEEHLRHRQLHADEHRRPRPCSRRQAC